MDFTLACDIMLDLEGSIRPAMYLAEALAEKGYKVEIISPVMSKDVEQHLRMLEIQPMNLHARLFAKKLGLSMLWFETWGREALFRLNSRHIDQDSHATINFSHTLVVPSTFWYLQGPTSSALKDMEDELSTTYKSVYKLLKPALEYIDKRLAQNMWSESKFVLANSKFCATLYRAWGIETYDIIYPPISCKLFQPQASKPSGNYVVTYFGKETKFSVIKVIADQGVKIKAFGSKAPFIPKSLTTHPNVDFVGKINVTELVDVYSNALFTLFPFTHEPFGYIPVESMACGTPTLTFGIQGPGESIVDGYTGWFSRSNGDMIGQAVKLWKRGYAQKMRQNCIKEAAKFDKDIYVRKWLEVMRKSQSTESPSTLQSEIIDSHVPMPQTPA
jgi:glycosyltransferase involved in cell wall biosynthesis